jgi:hypothetical protein
MRHRIVFSLTLLALFLTMAPTALASSKWFVDGVHGSDDNDCESHQTACKTIGHAISMASSGDSIMVAAARYTENLTIGFDLNIVGSGRRTMVIDGGSVGRVVTIPNANAHVSLSKVTIGNGAAKYGGGLANAGTLTLNNSDVVANVANGEAANGGGILNSGTLRINHCNIIGNQAKGHYGSSGGGIFSTGTLTINRSTVSQNRTFVISGGGGIYSRGRLTINDSAITGNSAFGFRQFLASAHRLVLGYPHPRS